MLFSHNERTKTKGGLYDSSTTSLEKISCSTSRQSVQSVDYAMYSWIRCVQRVATYNDITAEEIRAHGNVKGIIFSGGHICLWGDAYCDPMIFDLGIPVLDCVTGCNRQRICSVGRWNKSSTTREYGSAKVDVSLTPVFRHFQRVSWRGGNYELHGDRITAILKGLAWRLRMRTRYLRLLEKPRTSHLRRTVPPRSAPQYSRKRHAS